MALELTHAERIALRSAVDDSKQEYIDAFPNVESRTLAVKKRIAILRDLGDRLAATDFADAGTPPDLRPEASM